MLDPQTAFLIAVLMMLLNGGVLGLMHRDLAESLRPSATSWRVATLLIAGGCVLLAVQRALPPGFVLPLANGMMMLGLAGYWRALRQFYGLPERRLLMLLPVLAGVLGIAVFTLLRPDYVLRVVAASLAWSVMLVGCIRTLQQGRGDAHAVSRRVLAAVFFAVLLFMLVRAGVVLRAGAPAGNVLDGGGWINILTPMVAAILPVVGTTAFLLLCSERLRRQWESAASTDPLTGLANRRTLVAEGERRLASARADTLVAVAVCDIDHFKSVNDRHGHEAGDLALRHVAARLRSALSPDDCLARHGGEEFVVLLAADAQPPAMRLERLRRAVADAPCAIPGAVLALSVSIGWTARQPGEQQLDPLLRRADQALYAAKHGGRNRVEQA